MKKFMTFMLSCLFITVLSTSINAQVKSDFDKATDFSKIKSYNFTGWEKNSDQILNDFDKKRILDALQAELSARGMEHVESGGDVDITLYIVIDKKTSTTAYTNYTGGMGYGGRWGWGMGAGMGSATTTYNESDYNEGTFVISMFHGTSKNMVWQGIITSVVKEKPDKRDKTIPKKMKKLMKEYPVNPIK